MTAIAARSCLTIASPSLKTGRATAPSASSAVMYLRLAASNTSSTSNTTNATGAIECRDSYFIAKRPSCSALMATITAPGPPEVKDTREYFLWLGPGRVILGATVSACECKVSEYRAEGEGDDSGHHELAGPVG